MKTEILSREEVLNKALLDYRNSLPIPDNDAMVKGQAPIKNRDSISKSLFKKIAGSYNQNLIIAGVLVAGYFAYKKFKK